MIESILKLIRVALYSIRHKSVAEPFEIGSTKIVLWMQQWYFILIQRCKCNKNSLPCLKYRTLSSSVICWWRCLSCCQLHHIDVCALIQCTVIERTLCSRALVLPLVIWKALMTATCQCIFHSLTVWRKRHIHESTQFMWRNVWTRMYQLYCVRLYLYVSF